MYRATLSLTWAVDVGWVVNDVLSTYPPPLHLPGNGTRRTLYRRLGGPQGRSGRIRKISPPPGFDPQTLQPVASHYTIFMLIQVFKDGYNMCLGNSETSRHIVTPRMRRTSITLNYGGSCYQSVPKT